MRIPFIAGNWKMHTTASEAVAILNGLKSGLKEIQDVEVAVCPPFPYLELASKTLEGSQIRVGAQNMYYEEEGAFTGEVSPRMLRDVGCHFVILGHSERRKKFGETDATVNKKIHKALEFDLHPIVCVGETEEEWEAKKTNQIVEYQINKCLKNIITDDMRHITIAYEPVWAIGTGKTATPEHAQGVHRLIRALVEKNSDRASAESIRIQYGGSVKPGNARQLLIESDIDGALVGGASLKVRDFIDIVKAGSKAEGGN
jgi:triosephosphate isomerase